MGIFMNAVQRVQRIDFLALCLLCHPWRCCQVNDWISLTPKDSALVLCWHITT